MLTALNFLHCLTGVLLVALVLFQQNKGGLSAFGGGAQGVLGNLAPPTLWAKLTGLLAMVFFVLSLTLVYVERDVAAESEQFLTSGLPTAASTQAPAPEHKEVKK